MSNDKIRIASGETDKTPDKDVFEKAFKREESTPFICKSCGCNTLTTGCFCDELEDPGEVVGYHCLGCGNIQSTSGLGYSCDRCSGGCLDEIYE